MALSEGFVQVYTGDGKGKTTAALGLVLRALGHGLRPAVLQFMKADPTWGEIVMLQAARRAGRAVRARPLGDQGRGDGRGPRRRRRRLRSRAASLVMSGDYDVVVLDELITALFFELVPLDDVARAAARQAGGRGARRHRPPRARRARRRRRPRHRDACRCKHYYDAGVEAREGIEY